MSPCTQQSGGGNGGGAPAARAGSTPAEQFCRAIKKDKDHYLEFTDEKQFDNFRRATESVARTHGTMDVLTPAFQVDPTNQEQVDLFRVKQDFMYAVFVDKLKTDKAKSLVRTHETTQDAQQVWRSLLDHQQTSTTGELHRERIMCHLNTHKLDPNSWRGTLASYITHWMNQFREWEALTPQANHIAGEVKRTMLQSAVSLVPQLDAIKTQCHIEVTQGRPMPNFERYVALLESVAADIDTRHANIANKGLEDSQQTSCHAVHFHDMYNGYNAYISEQDYPDTYPDAYDAYVSARSSSGVTHGIDTPLADLEVFRSKQANVPRRPYRGPSSQLSMDRETWNKLEKPHQALWDQFPPHVKNLILSDARQRGIDPVANRRPVVPDTTDKTPPINKASSANFRPGLTGNLHETDDTPPIQ